MTGVRVLRRVPDQVRERERVEVLHEGVRLARHRGHHRRQDTVRPRRAVPGHQDPRPDQDHRQAAGNVFENVFNKFIVVIFN